MSDFIIYHNPRCSKSRQTLQILTEKDASVKIVLYLENPPSAEEIKSILDKLELNSRDIIRKGEEEYKRFNLKEKNFTETDLIDFMVKNPKLLERPIVVKGDKAVIGRPPENVLSLF